MVQSNAASTAILDMDSLPSVTEVAQGLRECSQIMIREVVTDLSSAIGSNCPSKSNDLWSAEELITAAARSLDIAELIEEFKYAGAALYLKVLTDLVHNNSSEEMATTCHPMIFNHLKRRFNIG
jgi:hypothetical protein